MRGIVIADLLFRDKQNAPDRHGSIGPPVAWPLLEVRVEIPHFYVAISKRERK